MEKIKTVVIRDGYMILDNDNSTTLTDEYIELLPDNYTARYLKMYVYCKDYLKSTISKVPVVKINGVLCPIAEQREFEIKTQDKFQIESLMINNDFFLGDIMMIVNENYI